MSQIVEQISHVLHDQSLPIIAFLQQTFTGGKDFMVFLSILLDPRYVFLILAPILFAINKAVGHRMIIALTLTEWSNQILKWFLAGERPYWYVNERNQDLSNSWSPSISFNNTESLFPALKQFPVTCELGAGSPSGHAMVTATVWYIIIDAYLKNELPVLGRLRGAKDNDVDNRNENKLLDSLTKICWTAYACVLVLISLSRVYLACHFPHQCICGALLGITIARLVAKNKLNMKMLRQRYFVGFTIFMFLAALGTYAILKLNGFNPMWTVEKATKWCVKKEYLHMDTTPFFSMMRYLGFCLGAGLAFNKKKFVKSPDQNKKARISKLALIAQRAMTATMAIYFGRLLLAIPLPNENLNVFYASSFVVYVVFSYAIAEPIPKIAKIFTKNTLIVLDDIQQVLKSKDY